MAISSSVGYDGSVDEVQWARLSGFLGARLAVAGAEDWRPTIAAGDRTVSIAAGVGYGDGVMDTNNGPVTVQLPAISSGLRWDTIVARRDWQPAPGGTTTFARSGGAATAVLNGVQSDPGVTADQPIALARVNAGFAQVQEIIDLRTWPSKVITGNSTLILSGTPIGTEAVIGGVRYRRVVVAGNLETVAETPRAAGQLTNVSFSGGNSSPAHGLGFRPTVFVPVPRLGDGAILVTLAVGANPLTATNVALRAFVASTGAEYSGTLSAIDFWASA